MKKKLFVLNLLAIATTISLSGCSFLSSIIDSGSETTPSGNNEGNNNGGGQSSSTIDTYYVMPVKTRMENRITMYQVDDLFVVPDVYLVDEKGNETLVSDKVGIYDKDKDSRDTSKRIDVDMSKATGEDGVTIYIIYECKYIDESGKTHKQSYTITYSIIIVPRRDNRYDPEDAEIKTLQISDVQTNFNQGDQYVKPKVWAIKQDNSKVDITASCIATGFDMNSYGYQEVTLTYNDHTISYEIVVHNKEEEKIYPFLDYSMRINIQNALYVTNQKDRIYFISYNKDGTVEYLGREYDTWISSASFESDNESVVSIDDKGNFVAKAPGTAFVYAYLSDFTLRARIVVEERRPISLNINSYRYNYYSGSSVNFAGDVTVTFQNGYTESVVPDVDLTKVDTDVPGEYEVGLSYTINGQTVSATKTIEILDSSLYVLTKTPMGHSITEYNNSYISSALPTTGTVKNLVIPVKFTDSDNYITNYNNVREDLEKCFFGTNEDVGWRSVKTYYEEESFGKVTFTGKVTEVYSDTRPSTDYYTSEHTPTLRDNVIEWYFSTHTDESRKDYDSNHDGFLDGINLIYLAPDAVVNGVGRKNAGNLWAMVKMSSPAPDIENPVCGSYFWASYDFMYPTKEIAQARTGHPYSNPAEYNGNTNTMGIKLEPRTFIHETGHMFGIDDYYSYSEDGVYFAGDINMQTLNYMGHDPYSLLQYNWAEPCIPETSTTISIGDFQTTHDVILLTPSWNFENSPFDEYFLIDLYVPTSGLNAFDASQYPTYKAYNTIGIRIWHVDARIVTAASMFEEFTFDPTMEQVSKITDNSYGQWDSDYLEQYDRFMELQLVRNDKTYDYRTSGKVSETHYFQAGDTFDMASFASQFVNGTKMDNGKDLGWEIRIDGIYNSASGYSADITLIKK